MSFTEVKHRSSLQIVFHEALKRLDSVAQAEGREGELE
jgi:hypothetical protein